jgi:multiple sugar transport system permease protein
MARTDQGAGGIVLDRRLPAAAVVPEGRRMSPAGKAGSALSMRVLMAPMLIFLALMVALPLAYAVWLSMTDFRFGQEAGFIGLRNYRAMLADPDFWNGLRVAFALYLISLALQLVLGCYLGMLLNRLRFARRFLQTVLMSPFLMPPVVIGMMWLVILDPSLGAANWLLSVVGLPPSNWLASPQWVVPVMALLDTWQWTPFVALLVLGGLQTMPDGVAEAAAIDGARGFGMLRYITLPLLMPTLFIATVLRSVDLLRFFDLIYITTQGGPGTASQTLNVYAFRRGLEFFDMGYASALMITLAAVVFGVVLALSQFRKRIEW